MQLWSQSLHHAMQLHQPLTGPASPVSSISAGYGLFNQESDINGLVQRRMAKSHNFLQR